MSRLPGQATFKVRLPGQLQVGKADAESKNELTLDQIDSFDIEAWYAARTLRRDRPWV